MNARYWYLPLPKLGKIYYFDVHLKISFVILKNKIKLTALRFIYGLAQVIVCWFFFLMLAEYILCFSGICEVLEAPKLYDDHVSGVTMSLLVLALLC